MATTRKTSNVMAVRKTLSAATVHESSEFPYWVPTDRFPCPSRHEIRKVPGPNERTCISNAHTVELATRGQSLCRVFVPTLSIDSFSHRCSLPHFLAFEIAAEK